VETTAGLVGVFTGVFLALWADRRRTAKAAREEGARLREDLAQSRQLVISSVVKNTSEAKRLRSLLRVEGDPYLFQVSFELAVWEAVQSDFVRIASIDERVLLTRFFDQVRRLSGLIEFHRQVRAQLEVRQVSLDDGDRALLEDSMNRLRIVADEVRIDGLVVVTDLGDPMHKRLLGMHEPAASVTAA